ncbi:MurR/RpiR family transcriptional regulator [Chachezhania sediminis]|uniref:MurR/RpiR family transcriptional regulator n=1 Tax=Chachezhania sediminis TaxID=2599291 RepID=UPI00131C5357|nr:MurR/RpiR family transcriptional regulator [Chachezhania sediminis]
MSGRVETSIFELMRNALPDLSPSERRTLRALLGMKSTTPLTTVAEFAEQAGVSAPTVLRAAAKLGFANFESFRERVLADFREREVSAFEQMQPAAEEADPETLVTGMADWMPRAVATTIDRVREGEFDRALQVLCDPTRHLMFAGGRFSQTLADMLFAHMDLLRSNCRLISFDQRARVNHMLDVGRSHVLIIYDFRRYELGSVQLAREAKKRRAKIVLVTDQWMSPIADWAETVLVCDVHGPSPFDSLVPAVALTETLIAAVYGSMTDAAKARLAEFEKLNDTASPFVP